MRGIKPTPRVCDIGCCQVFFECRPYCRDLAGAIAGVTPLELKAGEMRKIAAVLSR
jgi:hypothetical protein